MAVVISTHIMISTLRNAWKVLKSEGVGSFPSHVWRRIRKDAITLYWTIKRVQTLSIDDTSASFATPTAQIARRNKWRFDTESARIADVLSALQSGDVFYDIGANTGLYTLFASRHEPESTTVAFEPYPPNTALLRKNVSLNNAENVVIQELALSNSDGSIQFDQPQVEDAGYGSASIATDDSTGAVDVPTKRGDELIAEGEIPQPNVIKIDVEGSEPLVIQGLEDALSSPECRLIYLELHLPDHPDRPSIEDFGSSVDEILDQLRSFGFEIELADEREYEIFVTGVKSD